MSADLYAHPALSALELDALMVATKTDPERTRAGNFKLVQAKAYLKNWKPRTEPVLQRKGDAA